MFSISVPQGFGVVIEQREGCVCICLDVIAHFDTIIKPKYYIYSHIVRMLEEYITQLCQTELDSGLHSLHGIIN